VAADFINRKMAYAINVLVVANDQKLICALDVDLPGSAHDACIWNESLIKPLIEERRDFLLAADSAFPISDVLIKPFSIAEALDDPLKRRFNMLLSALRTVMTENAFALWKGKFSSIKKLRCHYQNAKVNINEIKLQLYPSCTTLPILL